jgi:EAL domain-containing protein (putative c-di-GMP-specific phosphodiesterase class I)/HAMP domain-containing protein
MSLSKQLLILLSALFLMIFSVNFGLSVNNIKAYMEGEAQNHAQDTATSLGLSLSPYMINSSDPIIKTMASAIFDMGYYREIRLEDANNHEFIRLTNDKAVEGVPDWFIHYLPMKLASAKSEISSGWNITGVVHVTVNPAFAYSKLYEQAKTAFYYSLAAFIISMLLLVMLLRLTLRSLQRLNQLALNIAEGRFETLKVLPWTSEVKNVAISMNTMSQKIEATFAALNHKLQAMGSSLLNDDLTGLCKKSVFETDIMALLSEHNPAYLLLIKIDSLPALAQEQGSDVIDQLLKAFAEQLQALSKQHADAGVKSYRYYGGEFAMLVKTDQINRIHDIGQQLTTTLSQLGEKYARSDLAHIGISPVSPDCTPENLLESVYEAYQQACLIGANSYYVRSQTDSARDMVAWKQLVFNRIDTAAYALTYQGQIHTFANQQLLMEEVFTEVRGEDGQVVAIAPFIAIAEKFEKMLDLDKSVIEKTLQHIQNNTIQHAIAVNLSTQTIKSSEFRLWLEKLFKSHTVAAKQLVFSFSAYAIAKDVPSFVSFFYTIHQWGGRVMIKRFETQSMSPDLLKQLKPDFVRLARELSHNLNQSQQKQDFVIAMQQLCALLDITLLAENVQEDSDYQTLNAIGILGASR